MKPQMKVQAARYGLMKQRPYLATAAIRLRMVASEACPHALAASEGWTLYYNPTLVEETELETLVIQLRREVERLIRRHARRLKSLPREVAETASAMEIDDDLAGEYGSRPDWTLPQQMGLEMGRTAEEYALALLDMLSQMTNSSLPQDGDSQDGDSDAGSSGAVADSSFEEESDGRDGASANAPTPSAANSNDSSANASDSSQGAGTPAGDGNDQTCGARGRSRGDSSPQTSSANAGDSSSSQSGGASGAQNGACDAQRSSDASGDDDARDSDPAPESSQSPQQGSAASGRHAPWETEEEPASEVEIDQLIESTLRAAAEYAKTRGGQGANMMRRYESAAKNKPLRWQRILARYIARGRTYGVGRIDYSYSRPHRRQSAIPDVVLPSLRQPLLDVAVIVDTSGSIDDGELGLALREVQAILKRGGVNEMRVVFGDTRIRAESRVRTVADALKAFRKLRGGGDTNMGDIVRAVVDGEGATQKNSRSSQLVVVITDGVTPWGRAPRTRVPVIAVITPRGRRDNTPAWVKEVVIDE